MTTGSEPAEAEADCGRRDLNQRADIRRSAQDLHPGACARAAAGASQANYPFLLSLPPFCRE